MMSAERFLWWWVERQSRVTEMVVRSDPLIQEIVLQEADRRNSEVIDRVLAALAASKTDPTNTDRAGEGTVAPPKERPPVTAGGLTVLEASRRLGCSGSKVYRLFNSGDLTGHKVGDKIVIDATSVDEFKQRHSNLAAKKPVRAEAPQAGRRYRHLDL